MNEAIGWEGSDRSEHGIEAGDLTLCRRQLRLVGRVEVGKAASQSSPGIDHLLDPGPPLREALGSESRSSHPRVDLDLEGGWLTGTRKRFEDARRTQVRYGRDQSGLRPPQELIGRHGRVHHHWTTDVQLKQLEAFVDRGDPECVRLGTLEHAYHLLDAQAVGVGLHHGDEAAPGTGCGQHRAGIRDQGTGVHLDPGPLRPSLSVDLRNVHGGRT